MPKTRNNSNFEYFERCLLLNGSLNTLRLLFHLPRRNGDFFQVSIYLICEVKPRPNESNISYNIMQLWCFMKCCTRLASLLYRVLSCCILLYEVWSRSNFSLNKCCTIHHFFCFPRCCMMYSFGHPMELCCTRTCATEVIFPPHSFVDFVFEDMFNRVVRNVAFVWPSLI